LTDIDVAKKTIIAALEREATELLGSQLDGPFSVISYPPGYNYFVQVGSPVYYNAATLGVIDQLCVKDANGIVSLTGSSLSTQYETVLQTVVYKQSTSDAEYLRKLQIKFADQEKGVISTYESAFGTITQKQIDDSRCDPPNKTGYIHDIIKTKYSNDPQKIPAAYAGFSSAYMLWIARGRELVGIVSRPAKAQEQLTAAITHTTNPSAANGGWQTGASSYRVAYTGLPAVTAITGSLTSNNRKLPLTVTVGLTNLSANTFDVSIGDKTTANVPNGVISIAFGKTERAASRSLESLWRSARKIDISIVYPGITILQANPQELSADLTTGWYSQDILSDIVHKTGQNVTGFQLQGSEFSVDELFGQGKTFARVKTFVISREPTVQLTFYDSDISVIRNSFKQDDAIQLQLAAVLTFGVTSSGLNVQKVESVDGTTVVTLEPPTSGTIPAPQQTAYIIGGVVDYPPNISASPELGSITLKNNGAFIARFSVQYVRSGETRTEESGEFPVLVAGILQLPADAADILVTVKIATSIDIWSVVATYRYHKPVTKSFELSGTTGSPVIKEI